MGKENSGFINCAKGLVDRVLDATGQDLIYNEFCAKEPGLRQRPLEAFWAEYVPAKLALGCVYWVGCCAYHRIEDKDLKNLFFKEVMNLFGSPKSLAEATRFSECLYASNAAPEQSPVLGVLTHLFHKLGLEAVVKPGDGDAGVLSEGFHFMIRVSEALKVVFETQFDDFFYANEDLRAADMRKRA